MSEGLDDAGGDGLADEFIRRLDRCQAVTQFVHKERPISMASVRVEPIAPPAQSAQPLKASVNRESGSTGFSITPESTRKSWVAVHFSTV